MAEEACKDHRISCIATDDAMLAEREQVTGPGNRRGGRIGLQWPGFDSVVVAEDDDLVDLVETEARKVERSIGKNQFLQLELQLRKVPVALFRQPIDGEPQLLGRAEVADANAGNGRKTEHTRSFETDAAIDDHVGRVDEHGNGKSEAPLKTLSVTDVVVSPEFAARMRCEEGRQYLLLRGIRQRRARPDELPLALAEACVSAAYDAIRPHLMMLSESIATTMEKHLGVRVQRIVQEQEPVLLDAEEAAPLVAPEGGAALVARRWYYPDTGENLLVSRSVYPRGRLVFRTELRRGEFAAYDGDQALGNPGG